MKYAGKEYTADVPFVTSQQITSVSGEVLLDRGNLMVFVDRNVTGAEAKYSVYNAKSNSVLFSIFHNLSPHFLEFSLSTCATISLI